MLHPDVCSRVDVDEWNHILATASLSADRRHPAATLQEISSRHRPENASPQGLQRFSRSLLSCWHIFTVFFVAKLLLSWSCETSRVKVWRCSDIFISYHFLCVRQCQIAHKKKTNQVKECLYCWSISVSMVELWCSKLVLRTFQSGGGMTRNLTSCVVQVELDLFSSHCDSGNIFFKHWRGVFLFLRHMRNLFDEHILEYWPQLIF